MGLDRGGMNSHSWKDLENVLLSGYKTGARASVHRTSPKRAGVADAADRLERALRPVVLARVHRAEAAHPEELARLQLRPAHNVDDG